MSVAITFQLPLPYKSVDRTLLLKMWNLKRCLTCEDFHRLIINIPKALRDFLIFNEILFSSDDIYEISHSQWALLLFIDLALWVLRCWKMVSPIHRSWLKQKSANNSLFLFKFSISVVATYFHNKISLEILNTQLSRS